jgi:hypothetical protein
VGDGSCRGHHCSQSIVMPAGTSLTEMLVRV